jgi:hypothetical protein
VGFDEISDWAKKDNISVYLINSSNFENKDSWSVSVGDFKNLENKDSWSLNFDEIQAWIDKDSWSLNFAVVTGENVLILSKPYVRESQIEPEDQFNVYQDISAHAFVDNLRGNLRIKHQDIEKYLDNLKAGEEITVSWRVKELKESYNFVAYSEFYFSENDYQYFKKSPELLVEVRRNHRSWSSKVIMDLWHFQNGFKIWLRNMYPNLFK